MHFWKENICIFIQISLKFIQNDHIDGESAFGETMDCNRAGDEPSLEQMMTKFTDASMRHQFSMS